jgi:hypothetical protein
MAAARNRVTRVGSPSENTAAHMDRGREQGSSNAKAQTAAHDAYRVAGRPAAKLDTQASWR